MNILSISGILPIPNIDRSNDFLIPLYTAYKKLYPEDNISFLRPASSKPFSRVNKKLKTLDSYELQDFNVTLLHYFSTWRFANIYAIIACYTLFFFNRRKILHYIRDHSIDVIHAEYLIPDGYLAYLLKRKCKIPYVVTTHFEFRYFDSIIARKFVLRVLQNASYVTPLNYPSKRLYEKHGINNVLIVPHGIEEPFLKTVVENKNGEEIRILSVSVLTALKNLDKVLYALSNLKEKFPFRYTIVGIGTEKQSLVALVDKLGLNQQVDFIDRIPYKDIPEEMAKNDLFIMPSYFESFGRVLFEAMAVGLPIICAKNTGIHGYFKEGEEGLSVDHTDISDIESKLSVLLDNAGLRKDMGQKAKKLMLHYTWDKIAVTFHDLYDKAYRN